MPESADFGCVAYADATKRCIEGVDDSPASEGVAFGSSRIHFGGRLECPFRVAASHRVQILPIAPESLPYTCVNEDCWTADNGIPVPQPDPTCIKAVVNSVVADLEEDSNAASLIAFMEIQRIAVRFAYFVSSAPGIRYAAWAGDDGGAEFVIHSRASMRQLTFEVSNSGNVTVLMIDEEIRCTKRRVESVDGKLASELTEWLRA